MSGRVQRVLLVAGVAVLLAACGEKPQTNAEGVKHDAPPWSGTGSTSGAPANERGGTVFSAAGWKAGDKDSWQQELKARAMYGQNDYTRP